MHRTSPDSMSLPHFLADLHPVFCSRRDFLRRTGSGVGILALSALLAESSAATAVNPLGAKLPHPAAKAKSMIWVFMNGGQSQVDTWDYKPKLAALDGKDLPGFDKNTGFFTDQVGGLLKSPFAFAQHGASGTWASEILPRTVAHVDDMAFIHSCFTQT